MTLKGFYLYNNINKMDQDFKPIRKIRNILENTNLINIKSFIWDSLLYTFVYWIDDLQFHETKQLIANLNKVVLKNEKNKKQYWKLFDFRHDNFLELLEIRILVESKSFNIFNNFYDKCDIIFIE